MCEVRYDYFCSTDFSLLGHYESLQDQIASIQDARHAVTALRDDHQRQKQEAMLEEQRRRQLQMQETIGIMRQRKHVRNAGSLQSFVEPSSPGILNSLLLSLPLIDILPSSAVAQILYHRRIFHTPY
jgi:hypothetical protein